jgi:hypothetical protein
VRARNATRDQIADALRAGLSNSAVVRQLRCDKKRVQALRAELGLPATPAQPVTLQQKWAARTRLVDGGHLEWTGSRQGPSGTPVMVYSGHMYTAARIAYRIKHGRDPEGYALPACDMAHCVAPDHQDDETDRARTREQLRYLTGGHERPATCGHDHDQAEHGRYGPTGVAYCEACKADRRRATTARR